MNYLVMISEYYPLPSANGICAKNIVECFDKNDNFYIVGTNRHSSIEYETISDNCELFRINGKNLYKKKMFFFRFLSFLKLLFSSGLCNSLVQSYYRKGFDIIKMYNIDCIITFSNPYECIAASIKLKKRKKELKVVNVLLDMPYSKSYRIGLLKKIVDFRMKQFLTKANYYSSKFILMKYGEKSFLAKSSNIDNRVFLDIPCFMPKGLNAKNDFKKSISYLGKLDYKYRNPNRIIDLLMETIKNSDDLRVEFYGDGCDALLFKKMEENEGRFYFNGLVSEHESNEIIDNSMFLINIENQGLEQVPSKIFKYFSTGKPIINFCNGESKLLYYFKQYGNYISINLENDFQENVALLKCFLSDWEIINFDRLKDLFKDSNPKQYKKTIEEIILH